MWVAGWCRLCRPVWRAAASLCWLDVCLRSNWRIQTSGCVRSAVVRCGFPLQGFSQTGLHRNHGGYSWTVATVKEKKNKKLLQYMSKSPFPLFVELVWQGGWTKHEHEHFSQITLEEQFVIWNYCSAQWRAPCVVVCQLWNLGQIFSCWSCFVENKSEIVMNHLTDCWHFPPTLTNSRWPAFKPGPGPAQHRGLNVIVLSSP